MKRPTPEQINEMTNLLQVSISDLIANDSSIFNLELTMPLRISEDAAILNRELHETTINHRLAYYLEKNIQNTHLEIYNVDIEYNRCYENAKMLETIEGIITARPDVVIHSRVNAKIQPQHYLVVEAKKALITTHDINKVKGFISDDNYNYLFGFTISYCSSDTHVVGQLFYFDGLKITSVPLNVVK